MESFDLLAIMVGILQYLDGFLNSLFLFVSLLAYIKYKGF